jgi:hypothetical protein
MHFWSFSCVLHTRPSHISRVYDHNIWGAVHIKKKHLIMQFSAAQFPLISLLDSDILLGAIF